MMKCQRFIAFSLLSLSFLLSLANLFAAQPKVQMLLPPEEEKMALAMGLKPISFMPGLYVGRMPSSRVLQAISSKKINRLPPSYEELEISTASMLLKTPDNATSLISNWWQAGFTGKKAVIGILDSGVPDSYVDTLGKSYIRQSALANKNLYVNRGPNSGFDKYVNGIRTAHGTAVACVYGSEQTERPGVAFGASTLLVTLAGDDTVDDTDWELTLHNLDWLLKTPNQPRPTVINYSFGNGNIYCPLIKPDCNNQSDWSLVAQTIDYIVNQYQISWVKSAGNTGWISVNKTAPYASTLSVPADSYNAIVVANMNNTLEKTDNTLVKTSDRSQHVIQYTSSRGPTLSGRRKPDITAPGNDTRTCAPTAEVYAVKENPTFKPYTPTMQYDPTSETRLVGGTSIATPHVGAATAILYDAGIQSPMAIKALLINSADTWTDNDMPGPNDKKNPCNTDLPNCGHGKKAGTEWNRTYGWGYINMDKAYQQKDFVLSRSIRPGTPLCFIADLEENDKVTLVWERRVGFKKDGSNWQLTPMSLGLYDKNGKLYSKDDSRIDNVLQVANYPYAKQRFIVKVEIPKDIQVIDGAIREPFALVGAKRLTGIKCLF
jgi:serine protease AprX